jgi:hypothetical protein
MKRRFNTAGPCRPDLHYMIPAARRLPEAPGLVEQMGYFVVHAPRQTGKTTALRALAEQLTATGRYAALLVSCETGEAAGDDYEAAQRSVLGELRVRSEISLPAELRPPPLSTTPAADSLRLALTAWARACPRPIVLLFDEIDALRGQSLISFLRQLRAGFADRPESFPWSVALCGLRDVRDYKAASGGDPDRLGSASPFNIKLESLRLGDFSDAELRELYAQHTADTGQVFTEDALTRAFELTAGQPWLVNALGREIVEKMAVPPAETITAAHVEQAKERLITRAVQRRALELNVRRTGEPDPLRKGLEQLDGYLEQLRLRRGTLVIFDRRPSRPQRAPTFSRAETRSGRLVTVLRA